MQFSVNSLYVLCVLSDLGGTAIASCACLLCIGMGYLSVGIAANLYSGKFMEEKKLGKIGGIMGIAAGNMPGDVGSVLN